MTVTPAIRGKLEVLRGDITRGYLQPARYVIHAVGPVYQGTAQDALLLSRCCENCLNPAQKHRLSTIVFPAKSSGAFGYPIEKACGIATGTCVKALVSLTGIQKIVFVLFSDRVFGIYQGALADAVA